MANPFVHIELLTNDVTRAKNFYQKLFDWKLEDLPGMDYTLIKVGEGTGGGMMQNSIPGTPSHWMAYVLVDDVAAATQKAKSLGAAICKEATEIPGYGWFSVITDPTGNPGSLAGKGRHVTEARLPLWIDMATGKSPAMRPAERVLIIT